MEQVKLTIAGLKSDMEIGLTRTEMATKYGLPINQLKRAMEQAGLKGYKAKSKPAFILVDDTEVIEEKETVEETLDLFAQEEISN